VIRGGQTTQHWLRMAGQVVKSTIAFGALIFACVYLALCLRTFTLDGTSQSWGYSLAIVAIELRGDPEMPIRYRQDGGEWTSSTAEEVYLNQSLKTIHESYLKYATLFAWYSLAPALASCALAFGWFVYSGKRLEGDEHIRGTKLVTYKQLKKWSDLKWRDYNKTFGKGLKKGPHYTIAGIKFPPNAVEAQTSISGTVGVGKTNAIKELLLTVRKMGGRAIIYDRMGAYVRDFYDAETDVIINPFDARSHIWSPFFEANSTHFFTQLSEVLIPDRPEAADAFWSQAARIIFDYAAQQLYQSGDWSNAKLRQAILDIPAEDLSRLIESTPGRHFFNEEISKTAGSIRANLITELRFLEFLRDDGPPFSIREWIKGEQSGFVFLTGDSEHAAATRNIISAVFEVAANGLMTSGESNDPKVWFIMDEVPTLNRMPFLPKSLAEIRQFGGAFVVGYQVFSQLQFIYGDKGAQTIAGNLNNRVVFNSPDADTAEIFSKSLGSEDVEERRESISVGAHETRDGVGFMAQRTERRVVTASQIQNLDQFEAFIKFAYAAPTAFVRFPAIKTEPKAPKFIPYSGADFATGELDELGRTSLSLPLAESPEDTIRVNAQFEEYRERLLGQGLEIFEKNGQYEQLLRSFFDEARMRGKPIGKLGAPELTRASLMGQRPSPSTPPQDRGNAEPRKEPDDARPKPATTTAQPVEPPLPRKRLARPRTRGEGPYGDFHDIIMKEIPE
jgi:type IV conjugative transfer system coupling protein TraD